MTPEEKAAFLKSLEASARTLAEPEPLTHRQERAELRKAGFSVMVEGLLKAIPAKGPITIGVYRCHCPPDTSAMDCECGDKARRREREGR